MLSDTNSLNSIIFYTNIVLNHNQKILIQRADVLKGIKIRKLNCLF